MQNLMLIVAAAALALVAGWFLLDGAAAVSMEVQMSQDEIPGNCSAEEARQLDFWVGEWALSWEGGSGTNLIRPILGGCVIEENFSDPTSQFYGRSVSTFDANTGRWQQTWVDNNATYLDFVGGMEGETMVLSRAFTNAEGATVMQRMVFYNVERDRLDWNWENSTDGGQSWNLIWKIHYERVK